MTYQQNQTAKARAWANKVLLKNPDWRDPDEEAAAMELERLWKVEQSRRDVAIPDSVRELAKMGYAGAKRLLKEW